MTITEYAVKNTAVSYFIAFLIVVGGIGSFYSLGQLEDPIFTIKKGVIVTQYPDATADEVELEVTDRIEKAIQELPDLKHLYSFSRPGLSIIKVDIKEKYWSDKLPQIWDTMRKKIRDITPQFPPGVGEPDVSDDFNFVYGFVLAITGDGFSYTQLEDYADAIKKELSIVDGVARVELWGAQDRVIYLETTEQELAERGLTAASFVSTLQTQNMVVDAGSVDVGQERIRVAPTGKFLAPEQIGELYLRPSLLDATAFLPRGPNTSATGPASMRPNHTGPASERRALIISADRFEHSELTEPLRQLKAKGFAVDLAVPHKGFITGKHGHKVEAGLALAEVQPERYDLLLLPGGKAPAELQKNVRAVDIARDFLAAGKPLAAICHSPQVLIPCGLLEGRTATCYRGMAAELKAAGVNYQDHAVVVDGNLITSRRPADLPAFMQAIFKALGLD